MVTLVTGASGFLGQALVRILPEGETYGTFRKNEQQVVVKKKESSGSWEEVCDLISFTRSQAFAPDTIIHTAATTPADHLTPFEYLDGNFEFPMIILTAAQKWQSKFINIGTHSEWREEESSKHEELYVSTKKMFRILLENEMELPKKTTVFLNETYGLRDSRKKLLYSFIEDPFTNLEIRHPRKLLNFSIIEDVADSILSLLTKDTWKKTYEVFSNSVIEVQNLGLMVQEIQALMSQREVIPFEQLERKFMKQYTSKHSSPSSHKFTNLVEGIKILSNERKVFKS